MSHYCVGRLLLSLLHLFAICLGSTIDGDEKSHWIEFPQSLQVMLQVLGTT